MELYIKKKKTLTAKWVKAEISKINLNHKTADIEGTKSNLIKPLHLQADSALLNFNEREIAKLHEDFRLYCTAWGTDTAWRTRNFVRQLHALIKAAVLHIIFVIFERAIHGVLERTAISISKPPMIVMVRRRI